jgi:hypothetical protein
LDETAADRAKNQLFLVGTILLCCTDKVALVLSVVVHTPHICMRGLHSTSPDGKQPCLHRVLVCTAPACSFCCTVLCPLIGSAETAALRQESLLVPVPLLVNSSAALVVL